MSRLRHAVAIGASIGVAAASTVALADFNSTTQNSGNSFAAGPDWTAPTASSLAIGKTQGGEANFIKQGGTYHAYGAVTDTGNPASGVSSVSGDVGLGSFAMPSDSSTFAGVSYSHRSAQITAPASYSAGTKTLTVTMTDADGNSRQLTQDFTVDNTAPTATDVQTADGSGNSGLAGLGDTVTYSFSEPIDRHSIISDWLPSSGDPQDCVVRLRESLILLGNDTLVVYDSTNSTQLPLGTIDLGRGDYTLLDRTFGASGTKSHISRSGDSLVVTLGTPSGSTTDGTSGADMDWNPSTAPFDRAGNTLGSGANVNESGSNDREF